MRTIIKTTRTPEFDNWFNKPIEQLRFMYYSSKLYTTYTETSLHEDDDKVCIGTDNVTIYLSKTKAYTRRKCISGFTYDKKTKKAKYWFGKNHWSNEFISGLSKHLVDLEWLNDFTPHMQSMLISTNTMLSKILSGKITNPRDLIKQYIKTTVKLKVSPELYYQLVKKYTIALKPFNRKLHTVVNPDYYMQQRIDNEHDTIWFFDDMVNQAIILNRKIDTKWSEKRMKDVHNDWTKEIMEIELQYLEEEVVEYKGHVYTPNGFELINSRKKLFSVGKQEGHCVYTNYWSSVKDKTYYVLYGKYKDKHYTVGIRNTAYNGAYLDQIKSAYNNSCPDELNEIMKKWILAYKEFFDMNVERPAVVPYVELPDDFVTV